MNDPQNPLSWPVWKRGARLGMIWALLFFVMTGALYALMGPLGWATAARVLCATVAGPLLALALIGAWWIVRRPALSGARGVSTQAKDDEDGEADGHRDASAL